MALKQESSTNETHQRAMTAIKLLPAVIVMVVLSKWTTALLIVVVMWVAALELQRMEPRRNSMQFQVFSIRTLVAMMYVGISLSLLSYIRSEWGPGAVFFVIMIAFMGDTAAYFGGRRWGRHKLWPRISKGKTVEGALAGLLASWAAVVPAVGFHVFSQIGWLRGSLVALAGGVIEQGGDLLESWHKRRMGVKDAGTALGAHGGILDRIDGLLLVSPFVVAVLVFV